MKNPDLLPDTPVTNLLYDDFWGTPLVHSGSHKSYRPLCVLTFRLNYYLGGLDPWGYHLGNVLCHAATTALFTHLARRLLVRTFPTLVAGLLFAAHPIHTEAVAGVVGRADVLACLFYLLTLLSYLRYVECRDGVAGLKAGWKRWGWMGWVVVFTAAALLTKEQAVTVLAACATYDVFLRHRAPVRDVITLKILTAVSHVFLNTFFLPSFSFKCFFWGVGGCWMPSGGWGKEQRGGVWEGGVSRTMMVVESWLIECFAVCVVKLGLLFAG